jgi:Protein of unknown function (DUF3223)
MMGKRKPVLIGRFAFESQTEARAFIREILNVTHWGEPLKKDINEFVLSLLDRHPRAAEKIGCGVGYFTVNSDGNGDRCFYIHRTDGSRVHFSYQKSLLGKDDLRSLVVGALNRAVDEQIWIFRDSELKNGTQICEYTGNPITKDSYHVDHHDPTFLELYTMWLAQSGLQIADIRVSDGNDNEIGRQMTDPAQRQSWQQFHRNHARLRLLSPLGNLSGAKIEANRRRRAKATAHIV